MTPRSDEPLTHSHARINGEDGLTRPLGPSTFQVASLSHTNAKDNAIQLGHMTPGLLSMPWHAKKKKKGEAERKRGFNALVFEIMIRKTKGLCVYVCVLKGAKKRLVQGFSQHHHRHSASHFRRLASFFFAPCLLPSTCNDSIMEQIEHGVLWGRTNFGLFLRIEALFLCVFQFQTQGRLTDTQTQRLRHERATRTVFKKS